MLIDAPLPDGYRFRQLTPDDRHAVILIDTWAFPSPVEPEEIEKMPSSLTWSRAVGVAVDGPDAGEPGTPLAAMHASYPFGEFPVPGGTLPTAGLTWVGVHPQHRRRGLASAMVDLHLARCRERGEPLSALFAAEYPIYGRFGYGKAADDARLTIPRGARLRDVPGADQHTVRVEHVSRDRHGALVDAVHRSAGAAVGLPGINRPGWATRETEELQASWWHDPAGFRHGQESRRIAIVERDGEARGYALFRRKLNWVPTGTEGTVNIIEVVALDVAAARALWGVLTDLDLMTETKPFILATDDPVLRLLDNRRATGPLVADNLWVRVVDVPAALAGRRYAADVDVVLGVADARLPDNAGAWRLRATAFGEATCERTDASPDLELDVRELGSVYLGGESLAALAVAGLVTERTPGAVARAATAFSWPLAPVCSWIF